MAFLGRAEPVLELIAETPEKAVFHHDTYGHPPDRRWSVCRTVLIGDVANPTTAKHGQGGGMAIEDAAVLARSLRDCSEPEFGLHVLVADRFDRTSAIVLHSRQFGRLGQWEGCIPC